MANTSAPVAESAPTIEDVSMQQQQDKKRKRYEEASKPLPNDTQDPKRTKEDSAIVEITSLPTPDPPEQLFKILELPNEIIVKIFAFTQIPNVLTPLMLSRVCKKFRDLSRHSDLWWFIDLIRVTCPCQLDPKDPMKIPPIGARVTKPLKFLKLVGSGAKLVFWNQISGLFCDEFAEIYEAMPNVETLSLAGGQLKNRVLPQDEPSRALAPLLPKLTDLNFSRVDGCSSDGVFWMLRRFPAVEKVFFDSCRVMDTDLVDDLEDLQVKELEFVVTEVSASFLVKLVSKCPRLEKLTLDDCPLLGDQATIVQALRNPDTTNFQIINEVMDEDDDVSMRNDDDVDEDYMYDDLDYYGEFDNTYLYI